MNHEKDIMSHTDEIYWDDFFKRQKIFFKKLKDEKGEKLNTEQIENCDDLSTNIEDTLKQRGKRYGEFKDCACISQQLKGMMKSTDGWCRLTADKKESLEMIQHKIARILNGDPDYDDNWIDIQGYAKLVQDSLNKPLQ